MERGKGRMREGRSANKGGKKVREQVKEKGPKNEVKRKIKTLKEEKKKILKVSYKCLRSVKRYRYLSYVVKTIQNDIEKGVIPPQLTPEYQSASGDLQKMHIYCLNRQYL